MTIMIATVCERFALLSQDTQLSDPADPRKSIGFKAKMRAISDIATVIGGTGSGDFVFSWQNFVAVRLAMARGADDLWRADVLDLDDLTPDLLRESRRQLGESRHTAVVHVGYSRRERAIVGFSYDSDRDFESTRLTPGHTHSPQPDTSDRDWAELRDLWTAAALGHETEDFHVKLAINQHRRGLADAGIGGELQTARVGTDGAITIRTSHTFPPELARS